MASVRGLIMGLASLVLSLLVLTQPSEQQYAWRPQGRFGKRDSLLSPAGLLSDRSIESTGRIKTLDTPVFESEGILCVSAATKGEYRCFTVDSSSGSTDHLSVLNSPFVEVGSVLCVSVTEPGTYRCFQLEDVSAPAQALTKG